ncbi:AMP-binding protein [Chloroflexota bacterium]
MAKKRLEVSDRWIQLCKTKTWDGILEETAGKIPDAEALVFEGERISYRQYLEKVYQYAKGLYAIGVRRGDNVALWMTNRPEWCYARHAAYKLGAVIIPVSTRYRVDDLDYILGQSDTKVLIIEPKFIGKVDSLGMVNQLYPGLASSKPGELASEKFPSLKAVVSVDGSFPGCFTIDEVLEKGKEVSDSDIKVELTPDDIIHIIYSSGTTGFPKGIITPNMCNVAYSAISTELFSLKEGARYLIVLPFFGNIGLWSMSMCLLSGATLVMTTRFSPADTFQIIEKEKITHAMLVPTTLIDMLAHPDFDKYDLSSLKHITSAGAVVPSTIIREFKQRTGVDIMNCYGLAEASGLSTWVPEGDTPEHVEKTVGLPMPHSELAILDVDTDKPLPPEQEGELCTREVFPGSQHMKGYYKKPELTADTIRDGWLHSGDLGKMDEDGYVYITGRVKEMYTVGGFNVSPPETEDFLLKHPKIEAVSIVGVPEERLGEVGAAFIRLKKGETATETEIIQYCKEKIADIKVPRYVFFIEQFPLNPQGKVQKFKQREWAVKELGLKERK